MDSDRNDNGVSSTSATSLLPDFHLSKPHTLSQDTGDNLTTIDAQSNPQVFHHVTLNNAPIWDSRLRLEE